MRPVELIVNVYNGEKYLSETLQSLVNQDYPSLRIHCVNNHSADDSANIINDFKEKYNNFYSYKTPIHMPLVDARLFAISEILIPQESVFYFGFCDADDLWDKRWVSSLIAFADQNYDILLCNGYTLEGEKKVPVSSYLSMSRHCPFSCPVSIQSCLFRSSLIETETIFFNNNFPIAYDTEFWLRRGGELSYLHISDHLFYYRIHANSMLQTNFFPVLRERWGMLKLHNLSLPRFLIDLLVSYYP